MFATLQDSRPPTSAGITNASAVCMDDDFPSDHMYGLTNTIGTLARFQSTTTKNPPRWSQHQDGFFYRGKPNNETPSYIVAFSSQMIFAQNVFDSIYEME